MTVSSNTNKVTYAGDGATTVFAFTFPILDESHFTIQEINDTTGVATTQTLTTHYTVSGTGNDTGSTNYTSGNITMITAPASGVTLVVKRNMPFQQGTDYVENDTFPAEAHEAALDELTMSDQQLKEEVDQAIRLPSSITSVSAEIAVGTLTADQYLKLNGSADGWEFATLSTASGLGNVADDTTPQLGGNLDVNGKTITSASGGDITIDPDTTGTLNLGSADATVAVKSTMTVIDEIQHEGDTNNKMQFTTDTQTFVTGGTSRLDITDSGVRMGQANARVTTILDEDDMSSDSATSLATQQSIKAYVDAQALGKVVQVVTGTTTTETSTTTTLPIDDTIPQNTEGTELMTLAITPTNSSNKLIIEFTGFFSHSTAAFCGTALFQDSTADALAANANACDAGTRIYECSVRHVMTAGTTSSTTFKVRGGGDAGTYYFLGNASGKYGGVNYGIMTIYEIEV